MKSWWQRYPWSDDNNPYPIFVEHGTTLRMFEITTLGSPPIVKVTPHQIRPHYVSGLCCPAPQQGWFLFVRPFSSWGWSLVEFHSNIFHDSGSWTSKQSRAMCWAIMVSLSAAMTGGAAWCNCSSGCWHNPISVMFSKWQWRNRDLIGFNGKIIFDTPSETMVW